MMKKVEIFGFDSRTSSGRCPAERFWLSLSGGSGISARRNHCSKPTALNHLLRKTIVDSEAHKV
jgi:hypothetical protein